MESLEEIKARIDASVAGARVEIISNPGPANQPSLLLDRAGAEAIAHFLRDDATLRLDFCSNVTGIDWLDRKVKTTRKVRQIVDGAEKEVDEITEDAGPGYLEVVYHLYSMQLKHGPVIVRMRTRDRTNDVHLPSLTGIWRSAELQEREIYDLYGIHFDRHPDLRRILMWDEFTDYPMRKDYREPDDYEYEPTAHDEVLTRAKERVSARPSLDGAEDLAMPE